MRWLLLDEEGGGDNLDLFGKGVPVSSPYTHNNLKLASLEYASSRDRLRLKRLN